MILDQTLEQSLLAQRAASGADRYDEVWEGIYMMAPMPDHEHQRIVGRWTRILDEIVTDAGRGDVVPGVSISDRIENWQNNYRVPDVAVFLNSTNAVNHGNFWYGGPDFAIEVISPDDQTLKKLDFYAKVNTPELLLIHRNPWKLQLYRNLSHQMQLAESSEPDQPERILCRSIGFEVQLQVLDDQPRICVSHPESGKTWVV